MQMRWGRYGVKSARWIARSSRGIGAMAFDAQGNVLSVDPRPRLRR
jgi:hypothetical protein